MTPEILELKLNQAWELVDPKPTYDAFNMRFPIPDTTTLLKQEKDFPELGIASLLTLEEQLELDKLALMPPPRGLTILSLIATISEALSGCRLAAIIDEKTGIITGWKFIDRRIINDR